MYVERQVILVFWFLLICTGVWPVPAPGDTPVRSHPLAAVAAVVRRRSSLRPVGLELFMINPSLEPHLQQQMQHYSAPYWDTPSAFFTFRWGGCLCGLWGLLLLVLVLCSSRDSHTSWWACFVACRTR